MRIELITPEQHELLASLMDKHPNLCLQNKGYETPDKDSFSELDKKAHEIVTTLLKHKIKGFNSFTNFKYSKNSNERQIRFQYNYNWDNAGMPFSGVGYILFDELLNGF